MTAMEIRHSTDAYAELLTCYAFEVLDEDESRDVAQHIAECAACSAEVQSLREAAADIPYALPDVNPHPRVRERVLASLNGNRRAPLEQPLPGVFVMRRSQQKWRKTPYEGVEYKVLYVDNQTKNVTSLLKLQPGAAYPAHHHAGVEQCLVLEGTVRIGQIILESGDFEYANAGTEHAVVQSDSGCVLMLISNQDDEVFV